MPWWFGRLGLGLGVDYGGLAGAGLRVGQGIDARVVDTRASGGEVVMSVYLKAVEVFLGPDDAGVAGWGGVWVFFLEGVRTIGEGEAIGGFVAA